MSPAKSKTTKTARSRPAVQLRGERIRQLREKLNLSQTEFAHEAKCPAPSVVKYEYSRTDPTLAKAADLARACRTSIDYLAGLTDDPSPPPAPKPRKG